MLDIERLIEILDQVLRIFESDGEPRHAARDAGLGELRVGVAPLRREHGQAAEAFDAAQAGGPLDQLSADRRTRSARACPPPRSTQTMPPNPFICFFASA